MKKFLFWALVLVVFIVGVAKLQQYTINGVIIENRGSVVVVEDITGNLWSVEVEAFTYSEGDRVTLTLKDRGTTSRADDEVVNIQPIAE